MASLRRAKKEAKKRGEIFLNPKKQYTEKEILRKSVESNVKETNKRLKELDQKGYYNSWASKKLFDRLDGKVGALQKTKLGKVSKVKVTSDMNITQLTAVNRATKTFLQSETSTVKGIESVESRTKKSMYNTLKLKDNEITKDDIDVYYSMLSDPDFNYFADKYGSSDIWALIEEAKEYEDSQEVFLRRFDTLITLNDEDVRQKAINLYNKYVA